MTKEEADAIRERRKGLSIASVSAGPAVAALLDEAGEDIDALLAQIDAMTWILVGALCQPVPDRAPAATVTTIARACPTCGRL